MAGENQQLLFFRQWTALEARQKAFGYGIFATPVPPDDLHCRHFFAADGFVAALATPHPMTNLHYGFQQPAYGV